MPAGKRPDPAQLAAAAAGKGSDALSMNADGTYPVVPLAKESVSLAVMQTRVRPVNAARPEPGRRENLEHMIEVIDNTQTYGPTKDILSFHEFPITGFRFEWNRADVLRVAIEVPGPETEALGNICTSSVQREPELFRAMALKGGEMFLRTATGGFTPADIQACAMYNGVYTAICNNSISPGNKGIWEDAGGGNSAIYDPRGEIMAKAASGAEQEVDAVIPIASYRARHRLPEISWPMYAPVYARYVNNYQPSMYTKSLPPTLQDAARYLRDPKNRNWK